MLLQNLIKLFLYPDKNIFFTLQRERNVTCINKCNALAHSNKLHTNSNVATRWLKAELTDGKF